MDSPHFYACGKTRLLTKKNTTAEIVPLKKSVPSVYTQSGTNFAATATQTQLIEFTRQVITMNASAYSSTCRARCPLARKTYLR